MLLYLLMFLCIIFTGDAKYNSWLLRYDGYGYSNVTDGITLGISYSNSSIYSNAEIYNNPCCLEQIEKECSFQVQQEYIQSIKSQQCQILYSICLLYPNDEKCRLEYNGIPIDFPLYQELQMHKDMFINNPYQYVNLNMDVKINEIFNGSRGWGFWNTRGLWKDNSFIWFIHLNGYKYVNSTGKDGFYIAIKEGNNLTKILLNNLDEVSHSYGIYWTITSIIFTIDNEIVHVEKYNIPSGYMAFHTWVDNAVFDYDKNGIPKHLLLESNPRLNYIEHLKIW